jgi:hypothetical protein
VERGVAELGDVMLSVIVIKNGLTAVGSSALFGSDDLLDAIIIQIEWRTSIFRTQCYPNEQTNRPCDEQHQ